MCGIAGYYGQFDSILLSDMSQRIRYRGPDDHGEKILNYHDYQIGLAHRRLSIIDLSPEGHQPMTVVCSCCQANATEGLWLIYNGELYNYKELRQSLEMKGHRFHSHTDSEVLIHLYAEYGADMLKKLNGMFAFALYDGRKSGQQLGMQPGDLLIARDGLGIKPLYYSETSQGFLFASELKALLASKHVSRDIDLTAIHYHLAYSWCPAPTTALSSVKKMQPGEAFIIRAAQIQQRWFFYDLPYQAEKWTYSEAELAERLAEQVKQAVSRQLMADVPVAAFLSGGLDSSSIVAMMHQLRPGEKIPCYTIGFEDEKDLEGSPADLPYARQVAAALNVNLTEIILKPNMMDDLPKLMYQLDEPQADPAPINAWMIAERARADGYKILLSGTGGDDIFSGYRRHYALQFQPHLMRLPKFVRGSLSKWARHSLERGAVLPVMQNNMMRRLAKMFAYSDLSQDEQLISYFFWSSEDLRHSLYSDKVASHLKNVSAYAPLLNTLSRLPTNTAPLDRLLYLEAKHFLADHNLNYTDKVSMMHGVEVRVPLIDQELVDFAVRVPAQYKQQGKVGKALFKKAMEAYLPRNVIYRPKTGFGAPLRRWMQGDLKPMMLDLLSESTLRQRGLFEPQAVHRLIDLNSRGRVDASYTLFALMCVELWCQGLVDSH